MKRKLFLTFACLTFFVRAIYAQDIITTFDGKDIKAKVEEVNTEYVKYKKFGSPDGTSFLINSSDIFMIKYIIDEYSYETDVFERNPVTQQILIKHSVIRVPESVKASRNPVSTEPASNGVFEIFAFDGASVSFRAVVATPI
jgi:hypothetical protein